MLRDELAHERAHLVRARQLVHLVLVVGEPEDRNVDLEVELERQLEEQLPVLDNLLDLDRFFFLRRESSVSDIEVLFCLSAF